MRVLAAWVLGLAVAACAGAPSEPDAAARRGQATPAWLPPYSPAQLALLAPGSEPVGVRAERTFPDTAQFRHSEGRVLEDPRDAMRITRMVAEIVERSPRFYAIAEARPELANTVAQYGPPGAAEPDAWTLAHKDASGAVVLSPAPVTRTALAEFDRATDALGGVARDEGIRRLRALGRSSPRVPAIRLALAQALEAAAPAEAEREYRDLLALDPTLASAHLGLAGVLLARGEAPAAKVALAHALAYHPRSPRALALSSRLAEGNPERVAPFAIFLDVDPAGAIRIASAPTPAARMYAGCRAVMRYEPELREVLFDASPTDPYVLSAAEEILCIESAIGAYVAERVTSRDEGREAPDDEQARGLMGIAHTEGLLGYVMFEIVGQHRPEHLRTAPPAVHRATFEYVTKHLLGAEVDREQDMYVAAR